LAEDADADFSLLFSFHAPLSFCLTMTRKKINLGKDI
jgi:hypothetical protein